MLLSAKMLPEHMLDQSCSWISGLGTWLIMRTSIPILKLLLYWQGMRTRAYVKHVQRQRAAAVISAAWLVHKARRYCLLSEKNVLRPAKGAKAGWHELRDGVRSYLMSPQTALLLGGCVAAVLLGPNALVASGTNDDDA